MGEKYEADRQRYKIRLWKTAEKDGLGVGREKMWK